MEMGEKIKILRQQAGMTLEEVGNIVGVGKSTVRKWESGEIANMRRDKIAKLAEALKTTPAFLMGWQEDEEPLEDELWTLREALRRDPDRRILFDAAANVRKEDILTAVRILDALKGGEAGDTD